jgi:hypothetical protein
MLEVGKVYVAMGGWRVKIIAEIPEAEFRDTVYVAVGVTAQGVELEPFLVDCQGRFRSGRSRQGPKYGDDRCDISRHHLRF